MVTSLIRMFRNGLLIYPFLFAIYPVLFLWSSNIQELSVFSSSADLLLPMAAIEIVTLLLMGTFWIIVRDWRLAALLVTFVLLLFFSYGHVLEGIANNIEVDYAKDKYLAVVWPVLFVIGSFLLVRFRSKLTNLANPLNVMALALVIFTLPNILLHTPPSAAPLSARESSTSDNVNAGLTDPDSLPDIWYLTAEGYSSPEAIRKSLGYDMTPFVEYLEQNGFIIPMRSNSNYNGTQMSLASSLNMEPLDQLRADDEDGRIAKHGLYQTISDSKAMRFARQNGYEIVYLADRFPAGREELGDTYYGCGARRLGVHVEGFVDALLMTTALNPLITEFQIIESGLNDLRICTFLQLAKAKDLPGPKVIVVHMTVPGYPFVIGPGGEIITNATSPDRYRSAFRGQLEWTNEQFEWLIDILLSDADYSPVIVIQGDHGEPAVTTGFSEDDRIRAGYRILNAYHLPDGGGNVLYETISPINTFRTIFNYYLNADFEILEDKSYLGDGTDVTDVVRQPFDN